jgi:hypothetical protein
MTGRLADFYIIGAMKCATSVLHEQLNRRQTFFLTQPKEPNFFNDDALYPAHLDWYRSLFAEAGVQQRCGEASTHYTKLPTYQHTAERLFEHTPDARLIYVIRHPVERLVSHYMHEWSEGRASADISHEVMRNETYVAYSSYARQIEPYLKLFRREKILLVFFERLTSEREKELERIARFLGDESSEPFVWHVEVEHTNVSEMRLRKSKFRQAALSLDIVRKAKDALPPSTRDLIKTLWQMKKRPTLSTEALAFVSNAFEEDLRALSEMLDLQVTLENFSEVAKTSTPAFARLPHPDVPKVDVPFSHPPTGDAVGEPQ